MCVASVFSANRVISASPVTSKPKNTINKGFKQVGVNRGFHMSVFLNVNPKCSCKNEHVRIGGDILWSRADLLSILVPF